MRPVRVLSVYFAIVFLGGALLAPALYHLAQVCGGVLPVIQSLAAKPFPRYVNRSVLILALIGLGPFLRAADLCSWRALGLDRRSDAGFQAAWGFVLGFISLACIVFLALATGARQATPGHGAAAVLAHLFKAGLTALIVAPLEELFFRGALFGTLRKTFHWAMALVLSSMIYALLHFLERADYSGTINWASGFTVLRDMVAGFADFGKVVPGFLNLTLIGMILGLAYQRLGSLYFSIGLHGGWIFWVRTYGFVTQDGPRALTWFFGTGKLINGWLAFLILIGFFSLLRRLMVPEDPHVGWKERRLFS
jgi:membrane protease YdiL (CAAX protease family)